MRVVLTGGGTGGHIYPALSVAAELAGDEILYVGAADGPEAEIVPAAGLEFRGLSAAKLSRGGGLRLVGAATRLLRGVVEGVLLLRERRPDAVLGTGGYASVGVMAAAIILRIPTVVHEANSVPGRANALFGRFADRIAVTFPGTEKSFPPGRVVVTGMPVRAELRDADPAKARERYGWDPARPVLLVSGGSGGAESLNRAMLDALPHLGGLELQILHQTGRGQYDAVAGAASLLRVPGVHYQSEPYIDRMPDAMAAADLIVTRAGSSTLAEITAAGLPSITVPYPHAVADHQTTNARALASTGATVTIPDGELTGERLATEIRMLLDQPERLEAMRVASRSAARPDAASAVAGLLREAAARRPQRRATA